MIDKETFEVMSSPTIGLLAKYAEGMPLDVMNEEEFKTGITTCTVDIAKAIDNNRIQFSTDEDRAVMHGLLAICLSRCLDGKVTAEAISRH